MVIIVVVTHLKSKARMISTSEVIAQVGTISRHGEREIGELIAKAMEKVGKEYTAVFNTLQVAAQKNMEEKSPRSSAFRQAPCCYSIKLGQRLHAAVSTNNGAMGNEEAASKN